MYIPAFEIKRVYILPQLNLHKDKENHHHLLLLRLLLLLLLLLLPRHLDLCVLKTLTEHKERSSSKIPVSSSSSWNQRLTVFGREKSEREKRVRECVVAFSFSLFLFLFLFLWLVSHE